MRRPPPPGPRPILRCPSAADIVQQTLDQVETDAQQRTHDALASEIEQLQQQLSEIDRMSPKLRQQVADAKREAEEASDQLSALETKQQAQDLLSKQAGEVPAQNPELQKQLQDAQRKAQETLKTLNSDQFRRQLADVQAAMAKIDSEQLRKQMDAALKNQGNADIYRRQLEGKLNSPEFKKQMQDAQAAAARLNSPEYRKQLDDAIKAAGNLNTADIKKQLNDLLAEDKVLPLNLPGGHLYPALQPPGTDSNAVSIAPAAMQGNLVYKVDPVYPKIAKQAHVQGTVVLRARISRAGTVEDLKVVSGAPMLTSSAVDAVKLWRYTPYLVDGVPTEVETTINVNYTLGPLDLSCTYYKDGIAHAGTCEEGAGKGHYSCRADDDKSLVQSQIGCESKVTRQQDSQPDGASPTSIKIDPLPAGPNIRSIEYKGLNSITITEVAARFQRDNIGLRLETPYDSARINRAAASLKGLLAEHGRLNPIIRLETHSIPPNAIGILFDVSEGPKSKAGKPSATAASQPAPHAATFDPAEKLQRIGGNVSSPELIYKVDPQFTEEARKAKATGIVLVNFVVDKHGLPQNVHVVKGIGHGLDAKAVEAVRQYKFRPAMEAASPSLWSSTSRSTSRSSRPKRTGHEVGAPRCAPAPARSTARRAE